MMSMVRYKSNHSNSSSRRSSSVSSASVHSNNSQRPKPHRSSLLLHQQQQQHISSASSVMSNSSEKSTKSTDSQVKRRQSLSKRIKKVFRMGSATSDIIQEEIEYPLSPQSLPNTPTSTRPPLRHPYRHPSSCDLPSPALSTVSTLSSSTTTNNTTISSTSTKKSLSFSPVIKLHETFSPSEYDRRCDTGATCQKLTPVLALQIKEELNQFKLNDMFVHVDSRQNTHFFI
ncbi:hypothetical protein EDC96DRAFT_496661 [Choanephora cucurbitarum]|nr:hypothetical protein EDC96DRAFT_496661 [Choanephora cucurbitarum]